MRNIIHPRSIVLLVLFFCGLAVFAQKKGDISITTEVFNYPVLSGKENNPVMRINVVSPTEINSEGSFVLNFNSDVSRTLEEVNMYFTGTDPGYSSNIPVGSSIGVEELSLSGKLNLEKGENYFWVTLKLTEDADLLSEVSMKLESLRLKDIKVSNIKSLKNQPLRTGVAVRQHKDDGVHTYRIPGLTTTNQGTLLAAYDVRRESGRDLQGDMDIGVSRSTDGGRTWEPMRIALDMGAYGGLPEKFNGVSDASILVDENSDAIYLAGLWMHGVINSDGEWVEGLTEESEEWNHQWRNKGSQPGYGLKETSQFLITKSTDDGKTWGEPVNVTRMLKKPEWWLVAPGPGHGITLKDGTLVFPTQGRDETGEPFSNISYSKDGGETWIASEPAAFNTTEAMAVELSDGRIMLNMRDNKNREDKSETNGRAIAVTSDLGATWTEHHTSHGALIEPTCMASIHGHDFTSDSGEEIRVLLFSNPNSKFRRHKQTIKVSLDDGNTWPEELWVELDEGSGAGYSCLTSVDNETIGIIYEGSQAHMTYQVINLKELIEDKL